MDPIGSIKIKKDSTFAMLLEAQARHWELYYMEMADLYLQDASCHASMRRLNVKDDPLNWFSLEVAQHQSLEDINPWYKH